MKEYKYLFFDLDGTIANTFEGITKTFRKALLFYGIDEPVSNLTKVIGPPLVDAFMEYYGFDRKKAVEATEKYRERYSKIGWAENELYDGIEELLCHAKECGRKLILATSKPLDFANNILKQHDILKYFDLVAGATFDGKIDTKAEVIADALERLGNPDKKDILMIGDRKYDVEGARKLGIDCLAVRYGFSDEGELEEAHPVCIVDTVKEAEAFVCAMPYNVGLCVFDMDGTIVDSIGDIASAMNRSLEKLSHKTYTKEEYYHMVGNGMEKLCRRALPDAGEEEIQKLISLYKEDYLKNCCVDTMPYEGICEMLRDIKEEGVKIAVISNKPHSQVMAVAEKLFDMDLFYEIIGQSERFPTKPNPDSLIYLMDKLKLKKTEVVFVGDSDIDIRYGANAGVYTIGVAWGFRGEEELKSAGTNKIVYSPNEIKEVVLKKNFNKD